MDNARLRREKAVQSLLKEMRRQRRVKRVKEERKNEGGKRDIPGGVERFHGPCLTSVLQGELRSKTFLFKLSPREHKHLRYRAHSANMYISEYIRMTMRIGMEYL